MTAMLKKLAHLSVFSRFISSIGSGKMIVEFFSAAISVSVCRRWARRVDANRAACHVDAAREGPA